MAWIPWVMIGGAGLLEIVWAVGLKRSEGFRHLWPSVITIIALIASFLLLARGARSLPIGTAYAVWTGIGAIGTAVVGIVWLKEPASVLRVFFMFLVVAGMAGLKLTST